MEKKSESLGAFLFPEKRKVCLSPISSRVWFTSSITSNLFCTRRDGFIRQRVFRQGFFRRKRSEDGIRAAPIRALFSAFSAKSIFPLSPAFWKLLSYIFIFLSSFSFWEFWNSTRASRFMLKPSQLLISNFMFVLFRVFSQRISI